jgi:hypothetical protein
MACRMARSVGEVDHVQNTFMMSSSAAALSLTLRNVLYTVTELLLNPYDLLFFL